MLTAGYNDLDRFKNYIRNRMYRELAKLKSLQLQESLVAANRTIDELKSVIGEKNITIQDLTNKLKSSKLT